MTLKRQALFRRTDLPIALNQAWISLSDAIRDHHDDGRTVPCTQDPHLFDEPNRQPRSHVARRHHAQHLDQLAELCRTCPALDPCQRYTTLAHDSGLTIPATPHPERHG